MTSQSLTQSELKAAYMYNALTGTFTKKISSGSTKAGYIPKKNHGEGYISICINKNRYLAHRLAFLYMTGKFPTNHVDHVNHRRTDNRWINLREATWETNQKNQKLRHDSKSGHCGVSLHKQTGKWRAYIRADRRQISLGLYECLPTAVAVRKSAEKLLGFHPNHGVIVQPPSKDSQ